jgi:hypothetical protein
MRDTLEGNFPEHHSNFQGKGSESMNAGQLVLVTLHTPREKFWGVILALTPAGVSLRGVDLESLDDFVQMVKSGEAATPSVVFFPMHRVQRIEVDGRNGELPSLAEQFAAKTGLEPAKYFQEPQ